MQYQRPEVQRRAGDAVAGAHLEAEIDANVTILGVFLTGSAEVCLGTGSGERTPQK